MTVVGRHCEAGDVLVPDAPLPADIRPGDLLAVPCTGAYHHAMASNYNLLARPPVIAVRDGPGLAADPPRDRGGHAAPRRRLTAVADVTAGLPGNVYGKGRSDMSILIGVWFAVAGGLAVLAGLTGMRRVRRLRRNGVATWAATVEPPARAGEREDGSPGRP